MREAAAQQYRTLTVTRNPNSDVLRSTPTRWISYFLRNQITDPGRISCLRKSALYTYLSANGSRFSYFILTFLFLSLRARFLSRKEASCAGRRNVCFGVATRSRCAKYLIPGTRYVARVDLAKTHIGYRIVLKNRRRVVYLLTT